MKVTLQIKPENNGPADDWQLMALPPHFFQCCNKVFHLPSTYIYFCDSIISLIYIVTAVGLCCVQKVPLL